MWMVRSPLKSQEPSEAWTVHHIVLVVGLLLMYRGNEKGELRRVCGNPARHIHPPAKQTSHEDER
jgi:hypothetical protein